MDKKHKKQLEYYEDEKGFGIRCEEGIDPEEVIKAIKKLDKKH